MNQWLRTILMTFVVLAFTMAPASSLVAVGATLASGSTGAPHAPEACTVVPRTVYELRTLAATPAAASTAPDGLKIDTELIESITDTVNQSLACTNANKPLAAFSLFTDHYLSQRFSGSGLDDLGHLEAALTRNPLPAEEAEWVSLVSIDQVAVEDDRRLTAVVVTSNADAQFVDQLAFGWERDQWLIDEVITLDPPATPVVGDTGT